MTLSPPPTEVIVDLEDLDLQSQLSGPIDRVLELSRSAKAASKCVLYTINGLTLVGADVASCNLNRKIAKRVEDLLRESAALSEDAMPQLVTLFDIVEKAADFGLQVRPTYVLAG